MKLFRVVFLLLQTAFWLAGQAHAQNTANCGFLGRKIQFADGSEACVRDVALFKRAGLIDATPTVTYEARIAGSKTYAIAVTANPNACPFSTFISWDWAGHDATSALPGCNAKLADAVRQRGTAPGVECRCDLVVDNGKSPLSQRSFQERTESLERQFLAAGRPLDPQPVDSGKRVAGPLGTATAVPVASGTAAANGVAIAPAATAQAQTEAKKLEEERKAREALLARQEEEREARELLAAGESARLAEQERVAQARVQAEAKRIEDERKAREAELTRQEEDRKATELLATQQAARRAEQERWAQAEVERRVQEERRRMDEQRTQEQARLARELADLRRMLEERNRAEAAARAGLSGPSQYTERVALIIGNRGYMVSPLINPINDAKAVKDRLQGLGFKVLYFEDLKVAQIGDVLEQLYATLKPGAAFVFFYAGHGTQIDGENFFPAIDAKMTSAFQMPTQSLELARVIKVAESRKAAVNLLILDACRDNPWQVASRTAARGLSKIEPAAGTLVFYATRPGSVAADGSKAGHGLFTYHLLQHLNTPLTPVEQVFKRVAADVLKESAGKQVPWVEGQLLGDFTFVEN